MDEATHSTTRSEIVTLERKWVQKCRNAALVVSFAWIAWILVVQILATDSFPTSLFVREPEQGQA